MNSGKRKVFWTRKEKQAREEQIEQLYPGYFKQKEKTLVLLGAAIFLRGVYHAMTLMINRTPFAYSLFMFLGLFITYCVYSVAARSRIIAGCLFGMRILEVVRILSQTVPSLFSFPFLLKVWWVTMMFVFVLDLFYLGQPMFNKRAVRQTKYYQMLDSAEELPVPQSVPEQAENKEEQR
mgnify:CR=1 FL=1